MIIQLPRVLEAEFLERIYEIEESKSMPYINTAERIGIEKGLLLGRQEGLQEGLQKGRHEGRHEGLSEGLAEGLERERQSRREIARNLVSLGVLDDEQIAAATQLDLTDVRTLRQQLDGQH